MSTAEVLRSRYPRAYGTASRLAGAPGRLAESVGEVAWFTVTAIGQIPHALRYYRRATLRLIAEIGMGTGAMAVIGGTIAIVGFVTLSGGSLIAIQGYASLGNIGVEAFTGFVAALVNVRVVAPLVSGHALAATVGAGATAELGAMRISEEIDALEVMGVRAIAYLVSTRVVGGLVLAIPLCCVSLLVTFVSTRFLIGFNYHQSSGVYNHYFNSFLRPTDVLWALIQVTLQALAIMLVHTYYG
ncbi:MAG TPA: ABC transporter permease, partial [Mycobacterium sp.]|nr:ABC transporter permease [Mycobacterium sp.]